LLRTVGSLQCWQRDHKWDLDLRKEQVKGVGESAFSGVGTKEVVVRGKWTILVKFKSQLQAVVLA